MKELKYRIGIVEDDSMFGQMLMHQFNDHGNYEVELFTSAEKLLENQSFKPDVLILDYHLDSEDPNAMNGMELAKIMKDIPKVILSSQEEIPVALDMLKYKGCDYIIKGDDEAIEKVKNSVNNVIGQIAMNQEIRISKERTKKNLKRMVVTLTIVALVVLTVIGLT